MINIHECRIRKNNNKAYDKRYLAHLIEMEINIEILHTICTCTHKFTSYHSTHTGKREVGEFWSYRYSQRIQTGWQKRNIHTPAPDENEFIAKLASCRWTLDELKNWRDVDWLIRSCTDDDCRPNSPETEQDRRDISRRQDNPSQGTYKSTGEKKGGAGRKLEELAVKLWQNIDYNRYTGKIPMRM